MFEDSLEEKEEKALKKEQQMIDRLILLRNAQKNYLMFNGFRSDNGFEAQIVDLENELNDFIEKNTEYLI